jgi:hypothetical protein
MQRVSTTPAPHSPPGVRGFSFAPANPCIQLPIARVSKRLVNQTAPKKRVRIGSRASERLSLNQRRFRPHPNIDNRRRRVGHP